LLYAATLCFACTDVDAGSKYIITVGDQQFPGVVETTGDWDTYQTKTLGTVRLATPGPHLVTVKADGPAKNRAVMNVKSITLGPPK